MKIKQAAVDEKKRLEAENIENERKAKEEAAAAAAA
jgi:hypothetical protein